MRAIIKEPFLQPELIEIDNTLEALQHAVGGYVRAQILFEDLAVIYDDEGMLKDKPYNCEVLGLKFVGTILLVGVNGDELTDIPDTTLYLIAPEGGA